MLHTGAANSITVRASYDNLPGMLGKITSAIGRAEGDVISVEVTNTVRGRISRAFTINTGGDEHAHKVLDSIRAVDGVTIDAISDPTFRVHKRGKIEITSRYPVESRDDISKVYTPGVGRVCLKIKQVPEQAYNFTSKGNTVAVVSDGSAVLGFGDIGPYAALPVMEGKALLFKKFADVDAWPIVLDTQDPEEIIEAVKRIAPGFGGINLEDIAAPKCFHIEEALRDALDIPVFHDDQHGTAVVVLAALINSLKLVGKGYDIKVVVLGAGAAGTACAKMLVEYGVKNVVVCDRQGSLSREREYGADETAKRWLADNTNPGNFTGGLSEALEGADFFLGVAGPDAVTSADLARMNSDAIVFALSNPNPEILPDDVPDNVRVVATGRSDYPNQVNNSVAFPGIFRGVFDVRASDINNSMKLAAAKAVAETVPTDDVHEELIVPGMFNRNVFKAVAAAVSQAAVDSGVARLDDPYNELTIFPTAE